MNQSILPFDAARHRGQVAELWQRVFAYDSPHNAPQLAIDKKLAVGDGLFFVAEIGSKVVGTVMAGYDGHRGRYEGLGYSQTKTQFVFRKSLAQSFLCRRRKPQNSRRSRAETQ